MTARCCTHQPSASIGRVIWPHHCQRVEQIDPDWLAPATHNGGEILFDDQPFVCLGQPREFARQVAYLPQHLPVPKTCSAAN